MRNVLATAVLLLCVAALVARGSEEPTQSVDTLAPKEFAAQATGQGTMLVVLFRVPWDESGADKAFDELAAGVNPHAVNFAQVLMDSPEAFVLADMQHITQFPAVRIYGAKLSKTSSNGSRPYRPTIAYTGDVTKVKELKTWVMSNLPTSSVDPRSLARHALMLRADTAKDMFRMAKETYDRSEFKASVKTIALMADDDEGDVVATALGAAARDPHRLHLFVVRPSTSTRKALGATDIKENAAYFVIDAAQGTVVSRHPITDVASFGAELELEDDDAFTAAVDANWAQKTGAHLDGIKRFLRAPLRQITSQEQWTQRIVKAQDGVHAVFVLDSTSKTFAKDKEIAESAAEFWVRTQGGKVNFVPYWLDSSVHQEAAEALGATSSPTLVFDAMISNEGKKGHLTYPGKFHEEAIVRYSQKGLLEAKEWREGDKIKVTFVADSGEKDPLPETFDLPRFVAHSEVSAEEETALQAFFSPEAQRKFAAREASKPKAPKKKKKLTKKEKARLLKVTDEVNEKKRLKEQRIKEKAERERLAREEKAARTKKLLEKQMKNPGKYKKKKAIVADDEEDVVVEKLVKPKVQKPPRDRKAEKKRDAEDAKKSVGMFVDKDERGDPIVKRFL